MWGKAPVAVSIDDCRPQRRGVVIKINRNDITSGACAAKGWCGVVGIAISDNADDRIAIVADCRRTRLRRCRVINIEREARRQDAGVTCDVSCCGGENMLPLVKGLWRRETPCAVSLNDGCANFCVVIVNSDGSARFTAACEFWRCAFCTAAIVERE